MLKVIIELDPFRLGYMKKTLHEIRIINNSTCKDRPEYGNYDVIIDEKERISDIVTYFERKEGAIRLLQEVLKNLDIKGE